MGALHRSQPAAAALALLWLAQSSEATFLRHRAATAKPGADCGETHHVISKYAKAAKAGALAGAARGALAGVSVAADAATIAAAKAREIGAGVGDPESITAAAKAAEDAAAAATAAATSLQAGIDTFKMKVDGSEYSGADVQQSDIDALQVLVSEAQSATGAAHDAGERAANKAKEASQEAAKATASAAASAAAILKEAAPALDRADKLVQEAGWAADDASALGDRAKTASTGVASAAAAAKEQAPVLEALQADVDAQAAGVADAAGKVAAAIPLAQAAAASLKEKAAPLKEAVAKANGGKNVDSLSADVTAAQEAQDVADAALLDLESKASALAKRSESLTAKLDEVEAKLAKA